MVIENITIKNKQGLHMRPAKVLAKEIAKFPCDVKLVVGEKEVNAKSVMNIVTANIKCGMLVEVKCSGQKEDEALETVKELAATGFGE